MPSSRTVNGLAGADLSDVQATYDWRSPGSTTLPTRPHTLQAEGQDGTAERDLLLSWAKILDDYNNGITGPGHCDGDVV